MGDKKQSAPSMAFGSQIVDLHYCQAVFFFRSPPGTDGPGLNGCIVVILSANPRAKESGTFRLLALQSRLRRRDSRVALSFHVISL